MFWDAWQILDVGSIWMREFASAMRKTHPVVAWWPETRSLGAFERWEHAQTIAEPSLAVRRFPLQRGYSRAVVRQVLPYHVSLIKRLRSACSDESRSPLICTTPFYAPLAERWKGPVIYYVTDLTAGYDGLHSGQVIGLDRRMCKVAHSVCPNSNRLAEYLLRETGCAHGKITVVPNATRESNVAPAPLLAPQPLPEDIAHLQRPVAGVIGNLAGNMDWELLEPAIAGTPWLTWVFVGPTDMAIREPEQAAARARILASGARSVASGARSVALGGRVHFTGSKSYGELQSYARCFDVAVLPYRKKEPTFSGSSTRFYEHLTACRPMLATRGFAELLEKPPLLTLVDTPEQLQMGLDVLRRKGFSDGQEVARWEASRQGTWEERVRTLTATLPT